SEARSPKGEGRAAAAGAERATPAENARAFLKFVAVLGFVGLFAWGYLRMRDHVAKDVAFRKDAPRVVLKNRPAWMSDGVAAKIVAVAQPDVAHSAFDHGLLVNIASLLRNHRDTAPWIRQVNAVRRAYDKAPGDMIEVDCDFRAPAALVRFGDYYWLVDGDGTLLPEQYAPAEVRRVMYDDAARLNLRVIEGVAAAPPEAGQRWRGEDLLAGIEMVKLLHGRASADEVERVNVANFMGRVDRREAQVVLVTRYNTQVRWGRPVGAKDFFVEVTPAQKLKYMEELVAKFGRVDAKLPAVDLRFDVVTFPSNTATVDTGGE
ncbi:MAG TPA: hypothetical protein VEA69_00150, partial [Tepidisphaeraceae bacterium]|nr:hypothetical protein [Tepidisphaeraceae bacterium]